ncbi:MAG: hypothetical protein ABSG26_00595 [Bryobacteraceae bacterium]|jgi:hypothetical protein
MVILQIGPHLDVLAHWLDQLGRDVERLRLAIDQDRNLILQVKLLAVGAMAVGATAGAFAFYKGP